MAKNKINPKYIGTPLRLNLFSTCVIWLMLDRFQVSPVPQAVIWTIWTFVVLCCVLAPFQENWMHPKHLPTDTDSANNR